MLEGDANQDRLLNKQYDSILILNLSWRFFWFG